MDIQKLEGTTEQLLIMAGVDKTQHTTIIIMLICAIIITIVGVYFYYKIFCKKITCQYITSAIKELHSTASIIADIEQDIKELKDDDSRIHDNIDKKVNKIEAQLHSIENRLSEISGIILVSSNLNLGKRRRIMDEDYQ